MRKKFKNANNTVVFVILITLATLGLVIATTDALAWMDKIAERRRRQLNNI